MRRLTLVLLVLTVFLACGEGKRQRRTPSATPQPFAELADAAPQRNPVIAKMLAQVSADSLRALVETLAGFETRHTFSDTTSERRGIGAARRWLGRRLLAYRAACGGRLRVEEDRWTEEVPGFGRATLVNVLATLPAADPALQSRVVLVCAHYDSRSAEARDAITAAPGANDDGSGVAALLELVRVLGRYRFEANLVFAAVAGEEQGLLGSARLAQMVKDHGWELLGVLSLDMIGNVVGGNGVVDSTSIRCFSEGVPQVETVADRGLRWRLGSENDSPSRQLARYAKAQAETYLDDLRVRLVFRPDRLGRGGDHLSFNRAGLAAVRFTEANEHFGRQHQVVRIEQGVQYGDLPEFVSSSYLTRATKAVGAAVAGLALAPRAVQEVTVDRGHGYDAHLIWRDPAPMDDLAGYKVYLRETTAPTWQKQVFVREATEATITGLCIDDYLFAVAAVDRDGNESLPVLAVPGQS
ncbi:MAG: M28 family metallopeptidase [candidate division KSB1 bacterium]|nr:M28 family metallopeptidase [candidate division KSB1 bacterium]MDZ7379092.1 M28 family metallopeptidase [candidate division KSB1 bacterium]MDZ7392557.1 M28 family metallopeptidase [candidate division KSB1 bacterium]